eukprot:CAMPEP_0206279254 /NCGR_PEP_ID=MMETSP0047_2-20121206/37927_1 /ASSEMBLY_ACC=CAM_ASM_000192 /TAXON_ID=195065 /ORGANISM="Chroomonas mesostigmatica_cf, Strain CCMP1168" /LENGTH=148 /DNA_ID=CAMNT_0053709197 /DNA_START=168 /DNA_END=616 /DNA_ORIENTATION=+
MNSDLLVRRDPSRPNARYTVRLIEEGRAEVEGEDEGLVPGWVELVELHHALVALLFRLRVPHPERAVGVAEADKRVHLREIHAFIDAHKELPALGPTRAPPVDHHPRSAQQPRGLLAQRSRRKRVHHVRETAEALRCTPCEPSTPAPK